MNGQQLDQPTFHERYEAMPPETRAELVGGIVYMPSPMRYDHGEDESNDVGGWLFYYKCSHPGSRVRMMPRSSWIARENRSRMPLALDPGRARRTDPRR